MNKDFKNGMACGEFEALLADSLDDVLTAETRQAFDEHGRSCQVCGPLFAEAWEGMLLVQSLAAAEPPTMLVHNILAATSRNQVGTEAAEGKDAGWLERLTRSFRPRMAWAMHSRFATSFAMAFFSLSITLTLAGVKIADVKKVDWHPNALRKNFVIGFTHVEAKVASYYENLRLVYQVQARVRELKKNTAPAPGASNNENRQQNRKSVPDEGGRPRQDENYSRERDGSLMAESYARHEGAQI
jgi:hypothetical protein